ncbi:MAG: polymer-forming cytoskeletal protein [Pyrinomonadaceae bacterium]|nr:polymer-forming cytoskeletal protein [Pyrinomonadaceae bacterium]
MLRMGKSHKTEQGEQERNNTQYQAQYNAQGSYAAYQTPEPQPQPLPSTVTRAVSESEALARDIKEGTLSGYVGNGTSLTGEANFRGMLRIDGHLTGRIVSQDGTLLVGTNGQVDADIEVAVATINGTVNGDIIATERLEMGRAAHVKGNIQTPSLMIEQGAVFEGSCRMLQLKESKEKRREASQNGNASIAKDYEEKAAPAEVENISDAAS